MFRSPQPPTRLHPLPRTRCRWYLLVLLAITGLLNLVGPVLPASAASPSLVASPNPVVIPFGQTGGSYKLSWNTGSSTGAHVTVSVDGGPATVLSAITAPSGTFVGLIAYGTTQTIRLSPVSAPGRVLVTTTVTTRRPDQACATSCIKAVTTDPHGTFVGFKVIATAKLKTFELSASLAGHPVSGMIGVDVSTWNTFLLGLTPGTTYDWLLKVGDEAGNSQTVTGSVTTRKRVATVSYGDIHIIDDADGINGDGDFSIFYDAGGWQSAMDQVTLGTGDTWDPGRHFDVVSAPDFMTIGIDMADDDCWGGVLCSELLGAIHLQDLHGSGQKCYDSFEQNAAGVWTEFLTLQSGFGEEFQDDLTLTTTACELQYSVKVHVAVAYI